MRRRKLRNLAKRFFQGLFLSRVSSYREQNMYIEYILENDY